MVALLLRESPKEHQAQVQAPATNLDPKPIKVLLMPDYVPSTGLANLVANGRKLDFASNRSRAGSGRYRLGRPQRQRLSGRMPRVDKAPPIARVKRTAAATSAAIKVPPSTPPTSVAHQLLQLPYPPSCLKYRGHVVPTCLMHLCVQLLCQCFRHSAESRACIPRILFTYVYLFESTLKAEKLARILILYSTNTASFFLLLNVRGLPAMQLAYSSYIFFARVSFIFAYNYKASYHHGLTRSCHKPIYGAFQPMPLFELPNLGKPFCASPRLL